MPNPAGRDDRNGRAGGGRHGRSFEAARASGQTDSTREPGPADERHYWLVPTNLDAPQGDMESTEWGSPRSA